MSEYTSVLEKLTTDFKLQKLIEFFKLASPKFRPIENDFSELLPEEDKNLREITQIGEVEYDDSSRVIFIACKIDKDLTGKESKKAQYELGKKILKQHYYDAGIFAFYGSNNSFRLSLIAASYFGTKREFSSFRRYTYFVSPELTNKTFKTQIGKCKFSNIDNILRAFSIEAVSDEFYNSFKPKFDQIVSSIKGCKIDDPTKQDFALLFAIRIIFLGFVQKKGWFGGNLSFIQSYWEEYKLHKQKSKCDDEFYSRWLEPLFFQALNSGPGVKVEWSNNDFSVETEKVLQMAPFLNGELFKRKKTVDTLELYLPDEVIGDFFDFLFQYNFTIDENTVYDEELELNPEFLGIIFEKFVNKEQGSVYTPRPEVDLMCRLSLLRWLEKKNDFDAKELYHLFFREGGKGFEFEVDQKDGNFSENEIRTMLDYLENVTICDPAAGSGAFEVGMLHVINDILEKLYDMPRCPSDIERKTAFERKKAIIARSLYGVEVQSYAVWINQLRLWLTLFIDMPDDMKLSQKPLLPSLNFKIRRGDSLVQRIGNKMFPVHGQADITPSVKKKITELKKEKIDFYYNSGKSEEIVRKLENDVFREILYSQIKDIDVAILRRENQDKTKGVAGNQIAMFDSVNAEAKQKDYKINRDDELLTQKNELQKELNSLKDEHPLIWSIEFAEIFYDKGGFDIIIGNPPYIRGEEIADPEGKVKPKEYKQLLSEMAVCDYSAHFKNRKIDGKSNLFTFFYARALHLLNNTGVHCFICQNSWLDVGYGVWLQEFLLENIPVNLIIDNDARRSFSSAAVNTVINIFDAPNKKYDKKNHLIKFVAFKKPFEDCIFMENLWAIHEATKINKNEIFRVYPINAEKLREEGTEFERDEYKKAGGGKYIGDKWSGKYLKAPDIFFTILEKAKDKLIKLKNIADVCRGITSGCNEFFYLTNSQVKEWGIEEEFIRPIIKSPQECLKINIKKDSLSLFLFLCRKPKSQLKNTNALKYINYGENAKIVIKQGNSIGKTIIGFNNLETLRVRKNWYDIGVHNFPSHVWQKTVNDRHIQSKISFEAFVDQRLYEINCKNHILEMSCILNSVVTFLNKELIGRTNLGEGALDTAVYEAKSILLLNPSFITVKRNLPIFCRDTKSIFLECGIDPKNKISIEQQEPNPLPDRKELDDIVFDALDLTEEERKDVYRAVCRLVWNRISKAKSV